MGDLYTKQGKLKEGEAELRKALAYLTGIVKEPNPEIANIKASLGRNLAAQEKYREAEELFRSAYESLAKTNGKDHPETVSVGKELESVSGKL
ncbi:MAG TPA: tetratricopeptide repeat protein [Aridibacter sp.]|nr:tetratricopeptide repeat protein [Aridibacter sp.]